MLYYVAKKKDMENLTTNCRLSYSNNSFEYECFEGRREIVTCTLLL